MPLLVFFLLYVALAATLSSSAPVGEQDRSTVAITRSLSEDPITSFQTLYPVDGVQQQEESVHQAPVLPVVVNESGPAVVIGVKTSVITNFAYRQAIRETWASQTDLPRDVKVFFVGCRPRLDDIYNTDERERIEKAIELEKQTYGDLLTHELDCDDSYIDLTAKVKEFIRFATQMFPNTSFVMVGNDDIYLRAGHLVNYLLKGRQSEHLYLGQVWDKRLGRSTSPVRDPAVPNYVSESFYPMSSFPPYARGLLYLISADCARFITKNQRRLSSLGVMDDVSVAVWLLSIQIHVEHTPAFSYLGFHGCEDTTISLADLTPLAIRSIHSNLLEERNFCHGFSRSTWQKVGIPLEIKTYVQNIKTLGVLEVTSTLSAPGKLSVTIPYYPAAETLSAYSRIVCQQARALVGNVSCREITDKLRTQQQDQVKNSEVSGAFAPQFLKLWRYNLFAADLEAAPVIVAYSKMAAYSAGMLECLFATVFEHTKRPILVVPEDVLRKHYQNSPDIFVFSVLDSNCFIITNPGCQQRIADYFREFSISDENKSTRSTKLMMIAGEPTDTSELDDRVILLWFIAQTACAWVRCEFFICRALGPYSDGLDNSNIRSVWREAAILCRFVCSL
ncbi:hypothetical protein JG688_00011183 [Phytophthora aleatoria]|uniref:Hexosyltransferase n=1 Tax=Phytophthora aleatoria TaxID=2496075 RepID=A0A8J5J4I8_9STRA|nr:hypothetical protein JG688_00011183 [Phytophthora aleatoria]